jgi:hypothetical protein
MAHFAKLDENNVVIDINVVNNEDILNLPFPESEPIGVEFLTKWSGGYTNWKQTSYNSNFRKNYACLGGVYDLHRDAFIFPQPYPSWVLDEDKCYWVPPVLYPTDGNEYFWEENSSSWVKVESE